MNGAEDGYVNESKGSSEEGISRMMEAADKCQSSDTIDERCTIIEKHSGHTTSVSQESDL